MRRSVPTIIYRRKREQKTNYRKRLGLLKSGKNRLIIRKSNKYIVMQIIAFNPKGDKIIKTCTSKELIKLGWKYSCKNIPASYLTGLIIASKMKQEKDKACIVDFGLQNLMKGNNKLYSGLKGAIDGGLEIPVGEDIFPKEDEILGKRMSEDMQKLIIDIKNKLL